MNSLKILYVSVCFPNKPEVNASVAPPKLTAGSRHLNRNSNVFAPKFIDFCTAAGSHWFIDTLTPHLMSTCLVLSASLAAGFSNKLGPSLCCKNNSCSAGDQSDCRQRQQHRPYLTTSHQNHQRMERQLGTARQPQTSKWQPIWHDNCNNFFEKQAKVRRLRRLGISS